MPQLKITIDKREVELAETDESPVQISYNLEDENDSQVKSSAMAFDAEFPATLNNDKLFNTFHEPDVIDLTADGVYRKSRTAHITVDGVNVLTGKALLKAAASTDKPESYTVNFYGDNGDWMVEMQDMTLHDCLPTNTHWFALYGGGGVGSPGVPPYGIEDSWGFDGMQSDKTWVYAPVRYAEAFDGGDTNMKITQMRPSLFVYWMIQRAFAKIGYTIKSEVMDGQRFRRLVMPWTWGAFLGINSKLADLLKFKATGPQDLLSHTFNLSIGTFTASGGGGGVITTPTNGDFKLTSTESPRGFDNFAVYSSNTSTGLWTWTYKETGGHFGTITARFGVMTMGFVNASMGSYSTILMDIYKNASIISTLTIYDAHSGGTSSATDGSSATPRYTNFQVSGLVVNDTVSIRFRFDYFKSFTGAIDINLPALFPSTPDSLTTFELFGIEIEPGGTVTWQNFEQFKSYKFLDLLRGVIDAFDMVVTSDPNSRTVVIEPAHPGSVGGSLFNGYFKTSRLDWTNKQDQSHPTEVVSFDDRERDFIFRMRDDTNDGGVQVVNKRFGFDLSAGKYRFSARFKEGERFFENRFFSPVMHLRMTQWKTLSGGVSPQMVAIVPENISNTSATESETVFQPKLCYYKGYLINSIHHVGRFVMNGYAYDGYPYMFAVNYQSGGENDIILTYNDQRIGSVVGAGLIRRFFLQRLAIQDHGVKYRPWMMLQNSDVANWAHRERIIIRNSVYLLTNIDRWDPINRAPVQVTLWKFAPVEAKHAAAVYPSSASVMGTLSPVPTPDIGYQQNIILSTDLP